MGLEPEVFSSTCPHARSLADWRSSVAHMGHDMLCNRQIKAAVPSDSCPTWASKIGCEAWLAVGVTARWCWRGTAGVERTPWCLWTLARPNASGAERRTSVAAPTNARRSRSDSECQRRVELRVELDFRSRSTACCPVDGSNLCAF